MRNKKKNASIIVNYSKLINDTCRQHHAFGKSKGITLVALVVTIVVLLILAGVTIMTLLGENGIIAKAIKAKEKTEKATIEEQRKSAQIEASMNLQNTEYKGVTIPAKFAPTRIEGENEIDEGLVITDYKGNEFVYVPVVDINIMAKETYGTDSNGRTNYQGKLYTFSSNGEDVTAKEMGRYGQGNYLNMREPSLITGDPADSYAVLDSVEGSEYDADSSYYHDILGYNSTIEFGKAMQEEYNAMVESVDKYGGFYVGRYETSISETTVASIAGKSPLIRLNWYEMYLYQSSNYKKNPFYSNSSVTSSMIWGSQCDAMLNWILTGSDKAKVTANTNGNHSGSIVNTGDTTTDIINNIHDLEGNILEWSQTAWYPSLRLFVGRRL